MKLKYNLILIFFINILTFSSSSLGSENWIHVKEGDDIGYKIISFNEDLADKYLGVKDIEEVFGKHAQVGAYRYYKVINISYYDDLYPDNDNKTWGGWVVDVDMWGWINNDMWRFNEKSRSKRYHSLIILADPVFLGDSFMNIELLIPPYFIPNPVEDYLDAINWSHKFKVEGKVISYKFEELKGKELEMIYEFASNGFLLNQKLLTNKNEIIYEYGVENKPIISLKFFFIILGVIFLSILIIEFVYIKLKKMQSFKKKFDKT